MTGMVHAHTGVAEEKKSMSFPMVNGMLMDTDEETKSRPIAAAKGLRSGFASETIFLNDDALSDA
jgi:hypothetical protein